MSKFKFKKNKGIVFWVEGFSGSGKSSLAKSSLKGISKIFGKTIYVSGDSLRRIFDLHGYKKSDRTKNSHRFSNFIKFLQNQNINVIYTVVCLNHKARSIYKKKLSNFFQILLDADINKIIRFNKKKKVYKKKKNIVGLDIKAEKPLNPQVVINNDFNRSETKLAKELVDKIKLMI